MKKKDGRQVAFCFSASHEETRDWWIWSINRSTDRTRNAVTHNVKKHHPENDTFTEEELAQVDLHVQLHESVLFMHTWKACVILMDNDTVSLLSVTVIFGLERRAIEKSFHCSSIRAVRRLEDGETLPNIPTAGERNGQHCFLFELKEGSVVCVGVPTERQCSLLVSKINAFVSQYHGSFSPSSSSSSSYSSSSSSSSSAVEGMAPPPRDVVSGLVIVTSENEKEEEDAVVDILSSTTTETTPPSPSIEPILSSSPSPSPSPLDEGLSAVSIADSVVVPPFGERQNVEGVIEEEEDEEGSFL